jgi:hypothetical protein
MTTDLLRTVKQPAISMRDLVYGKPVARSPRFRLPTRAIFLAAFLGTSIGCVTARPPVADAPETVGALSASATHVYVQPVHADTDLSIAYQPAGGDEDAAEPMKVAAKPDAAPSDEAPEVIEKNAHGF